MSRRVEVELDDRGRLVLPPSVGRELGLVPGMTLVVEEEPSGSTSLRIDEQMPRLLDCDGVLVVVPEESRIEEESQAERDERVAELIRRTGL